MASVQVLKETSNKENQIQTNCQFNLLIVSNHLQKKLNNYGFYHRNNKGISLEIGLGISKKDSLRDAFACRSS